MIVRRRLGRRRFRSLGARLTDFGRARAARYAPPALAAPAAETPAAWQEAATRPLVWKLPGGEPTVAGMPEALPPDEFEPTPDLLAILQGHAEQRALESEAPARAGEPPAQPATPRSQPARPPQPTVDRVTKRPRSALLEEVTPAQASTPAEAIEVAADVQPPRPEAPPVSTPAVPGDFTHQAPPRPPDAPPVAGRPAPAATPRPAAPPQPTPPPSTPAPAPLPHTAQADVQPASSEEADNALPPAPSPLDWPAPGKAAAPPKLVPRPDIGQDFQRAAQPPADVQRANEPAALEARFHAPPAPLAEAQPAVGDAEPREHEETQTRRHQGAETRSHEGTKAQSRDLSPPPPSRRREATGPVGEQARQVGDLPGEEAPTEHERDLYTALVAVGGEQARTVAPVDRLEPPATAAPAPPDQPRALAGRSESVPPPAARELPTPPEPAALPAHEGVRPSWTAAQPDPLVSRPQSQAARAAAAPTAPDAALLQLLGLPTETPVAGREPTPTPPAAAGPPPHRAPREPSPPPADSHADGRAARGRVSRVPAPPETPAGDEAGPLSPAAGDIDRLARDVYSILRDRLRVERERSAGRW